MMTTKHDTLFSAPPWLRWLAVLAWLGVTGALLLLPGDGPIVANTHDLIGGTELADWFGHVVLFAVLAALVYWALGAHVAPPATLRATLVSTILLGAAIEAAQLLIDSRGASVLDAVGNGLGVVLFAAWIWRRERSPVRDRQNR
jgi:VanZ family protein